MNKEKLINEKADAILDDKLTYKLFHQKRITQLEHSYANTHGEVNKRKRARKTQRKARKITRKNR